MSAELQAAAEKMTLCDSNEEAWANWHSFKSGRTDFHVDKRYEAIARVGKGSYGVVTCCKDTKTKEKVALKKVMGLFSSSTDTIRILREIKILKHLSGNRHICSIKDLMVPPPEMKFNHMYIVMGYMPADLHKIIYSSNKLSDKHIQYMAYQMICALKFIHSANIVHRDLKPSNILVNRNCHIRICDFGLARDIRSTADKMTQYVVTRWYRAPEVICSSRYDEKIDVWSAGCIIAEMLGRKELFPGDDYVVQMKLMFELLGCPEEGDLHFVDLENAKKWAKEYIKAHKGRIVPMPLQKIFPDRSRRGVDLLGKMLVINPLKRITVDDALEHPFFKSIRKRGWEEECKEPFALGFKDDDKIPRKVGMKAVLDQVVIFRPALKKHMETIIKNSLELKDQTTKELPDGGTKEPEDQSVGKMEETPGS